MRIHKLSILVPAYNEEKTISEVLARLSELPLPDRMEKEVIVVNDCSKDQTGVVISEFVSKQPAEVFKRFDQPVNQGKGAALHKAIVLARDAGHLVPEVDVDQVLFELHGLILSLHHDARFLLSPGALGRACAGFERVMASSLTPAGRQLPSPLPRRKTR